MALDIKPTRSELINLKRRIKQTQNGYNLLKLKRDGLFHEFRTLLSEMIEAREGLVSTYAEAQKAINLAGAIDGGLAVKSAAIAISSRPAVDVSPRLKRLLVEIEATKRRVNALEFKVIPEMKEAQSFIQLRLEEMEREETFRLKRFKNK